MTRFNLPTDFSRPSVPRAPSFGGNAMGGILSSIGNAIGGVGEGLVGVENAERDTARLEARLAKQEAERKQAELDQAARIRNQTNITLGLNQLTKELDDQFKGAAEPNAVDAESLNAYESFREKYIESIEDPVFKAKMESVYSNYVAEVQPQFKAKAKLEAGREHQANISEMSQAQISNPQGVLSFDMLDRRIASFNENVDAGVGIYYDKQAAAKVKESHKIGMVNSMFKYLAGVDTELARDLLNHKSVMEVIGKNERDALFKNLERIDEANKIKANSELSSSVTKTVEYALAEGYADPDMFKRVVNNAMGEMNDEQSQIYKAAIAKQVEVELNGTGDEANLQRLQNLTALMQGNSAIEREVQAQSKKYIASTQKQLSVKQQNIANYMKALATGEYSGPLNTSPDAVSDAYSAYRAAGGAVSSYSSFVAQYNKDNPAFKIQPPPEMIREVESMIAAGDSINFSIAMNPILSQDHDMGMRMISSMKNGDVAKSMLIGFAVGETDKAMTVFESPNAQQAIANVSKLRKAMMKDTSIGTEIRTAVKNGDVVVDTQTRAVLGGIPALNAKQLEEFETLYNHNAVYEVISGVGVPETEEGQAQFHSGVMKKTISDFVQKLYTPVENYYREQGDNVLNLTGGFMTDPSGVLPQVSLMRQSDAVPTNVMAKIRSSLFDTLSNSFGSKTRTVPTGGMFKQSGRRINSDFPAVARVDKAVQADASTWSVPVFDTDTGMAVGFIEYKINDDGSVSDGVAKSRDDNSSTVKSAVEKANAVPRAEVTGEMIYQYNKSIHGKYGKFTDFVLDQGVAPEERDRRKGIARQLLNNLMRENRGDRNSEDYQNMILRKADAKLRTLGWPEGYGIGDGRPAVQRTDTE